jgi:hypothetical protein
MKLRRTNVDVVGKYSMTDSRKTLYHVCAVEIGVCSESTVGNGKRRMGVRRSVSDVEMVRDGTTLGQLSRYLATTPLHTRRLLGE